MLMSLPRRCQRCCSDSCWVGMPCLTRAGLVKKEEETLEKNAVSEETEKRSGSSRRDFLKFGGGILTGAVVAAAGAGVGVSVVNNVNHEDTPKKAMGHIVSDPRKCAGCRTCVAVCSLSHEGICGPMYSRIKIIQPSQNIFDTQIITCHQCDSANCLAACPTGALHVDDTTGARVINQKKCVGCQLCVKACPQYPNSPIYVDKVTGTCFKCDLCGGDPQCVKFCPMSVSFSEHCYPVEDHPLKFSAAAEDAPTTWDLTHSPDKVALYPPEKPVL